ncbi:MAG: LCP family protein [Candidatus Kerfeldbacteria bacterium]|nr:LCP family protein [Candidatus Kerfeldbacteria bacterium]
MKRVNAFLFGFLFTMCILIISTLFFVYITAPERYTILFVGSDQRGTERARSDVLFLLSIPKNPKQPIFLLSIPRDTKIDDQEWGLQKITHFYAFGERPDDGKELGNIELTQQQVETLISMHIDTTVEVTFRSFEEIVNNLGGTTVDGTTTNGAAALAIIRDRFTNGRSDFNRQADEREVLRSLVMKAVTPTKMRMLLQYFEDSNQARLRYSQLQSIRFAVGAGIARNGHFSTGDIVEASVPGASGKIYTPAFGKELYYWIPDTEALSKLVNEHMTK